MQKEVSIPLPEIFFGNNSLKITNDYGDIFEFSPLDALKLVDATAEGGEKVKAIRVHQDCEIAIRQNSQQQ